MMRVLRKIFSIAAAIALVGLMGLTAVASADESNNAWIDSGEFVGYYEDYDRHVTMDVSGNLEIYSSIYGGVDCEVTGEVEVWNDWPGGEPTWDYAGLADTPAKNELTSLQLAGSPATACDNTSAPYQCYPSSLSFDGLPWAGETSDFESAFDDASIGWSWDGDPGCTSANIYWIHDTTIRLTPQDSGCIEGFDVVTSSIAPFTWALGSLEVDSISGLNEGDPCLLLW